MITLLFIMLLYACWGCQLKFTLLFYGSKHLRVFRFFASAPVNSYVKRLYSSGFRCSSWG